MTEKNLSWYAARYVERYGFHLIEIKQNSKLPVHQDWGNKTLSDTQQAADYFAQNPNANLGVALGPSRMCSLDIDCEDSFRVIMEEFGVPMSELEGYPCIQGNTKGRRIMFRVPDGVDLPYAKLNWPTKDDPKKQFTVFELRSACDGKARFDMLPPSIHPDTKKPYVWLSQPPKDVWPEPPGWLLAVWSAWASFKPQFRDSCPWVERAKYEPAPTTTTGHAGGDSIINRYNDANGIAQHLERYGYKRKGRDRWLSPHSTTKLPGVKLLPDGRRCYIHHASDPLCSDESGKPVGPFDLYCYYDHNNDVSAACKSLAKEYGTPPIRQNKQAPAPVETAGLMQPESTADTTDAPAHYTPSSQLDFVTPLPYTTDNGKPIKHIDNLREIVRRLGVVVRYNEVKKEDELLIPGRAFTRDNAANASLAWLKSECSRFRFSPEVVQEYLTVLADENQYNPVRTWIGSKPWDGVDRLQALYDSVVCANDHSGSGERTLKETLIKRWLLAAVCAAYSPTGVDAQGVLVFQGEQNIGKTTWFKSLVPEHMDLIKEGMILRPDDKDSVQQATSYWLVELGELDSTFRRSDIAQLKAFITSDLDVIRKAYARRESRFVRRTVFFGSVNPREYLHDPTGNRRYWTIECVSLNPRHGIDMQQLWAQVYHLWANDGQRHYLTHEEHYMLNAHNEQFTFIDPIEDRIVSCYDWEDKAPLTRWLTSTEILQETGIDRPTKAESTTCGQVVGALNGGMRRRTARGRLLAVPSLNGKVYRQ